MKRIFIIIFTLIIPFTISGQLLRSGNLVSETWDQEVQITADATIGNGVTITVEPGVTVRLYSGASLKMTGSGRLYANGVAGNMITFTAFDGTSWGHLSFNNTSAAINSELNYCIIEKGDSRTLSPNYGGGVHIKSNKVTISNSIIRNNKSGWGGGSIS